MKQTRRQSGKSAFDLVEEATHLVRSAPVAALAAYYLGAAPFVLCLLFFWADMSRNPFAPQHLAGASLMLALLFFWMKYWQVCFVRRLRAHVAREDYSPPGFRGSVRVIVRQSFMHAFGLFMLPLALLPVLPFPWAFAFFQNIAALDEGADAGAAALTKKAWRQAKLWPTQNYTVLALMAAFGGCVFLNWTTFCLALPQLGKMLFGIESRFTSSPLALLNSTFLATTFGLTYLSVDPILKAIYVLRCFYGDALESGEDLKAELKPFITAAAKAVAAVAIVLALLGGASASGGTVAPSPVASSKVPAATLDQAINQTIHERKYVWRLPREQVVKPEADDGVIADFRARVRALIHEVFHAIGHILKMLWRALFPHRHPVASDSSGYGWIMSLQFLLYGLVAVVIVALALLIMRIWRATRPKPVPLIAEAIQPVPDLTDENVRADQLPEDGWTRLARELIERGEFRLAMRAFYLASLAHLAERHLISIARFKSNRDYEQELHRRAHSFPNLLAMFGDNVSVFERIWYGTHEATRDLVSQFAASVDKMKAGG